MSILNYLALDLPVPYKGLNIYPIYLKDYYSFYLNLQCLLVEKNNIPDAKIISMTDLEYIYYATTEDVINTPYLIWFDRLLSLCIKDDPSFEKLEESIKRYTVDEKGKPFFKIGEIQYDSSDFLEIKKIICEQNLVELPDQSISKEVRDDIEKARAYKNKMVGGYKTGTFEDYIIALSISTGWTMEYIRELTLRKFTKSIRRMDNLIHYKIYLAASMSGMVEFKDKSFIKHWLVDLEETHGYDDVTMSLEDAKNKISFESAKNNI